MPHRDNVTWVKELGDLGAKREAALEDLHTLLLKILPRGLSKWLSSSNPEFDDLVEDTAQETLLRVLKQLDTFESRGQFTHWVYKIAVRIALNELRRRKWRNVSLDLLQEEADEKGFLFELPALDSSIEIGFERKELMQRVEQIINEELTSKQRAVMHAVIIQEVPMEEVARRLGSNRNAVYKLLHDARQKLKSGLEHAGLSPQQMLAMFAQE
jgi:RNA polymerase sigma-70 factor (ECF subfamily)